MVISISGRWRDRKIPTSFMSYLKKMNFTRHAIKIYDAEHKGHIPKQYMNIQKLTSAERFLKSIAADYAGAWFNEDRLQYAINDPVQQKHYDAINKFFDDEANIKIVGFDDEGSKAIVYVSDHKSAVSYFIYDYAWRYINKLIDREPDLVVHINGDARILQIPTREGNSITAYHYHAKSKMNTSVTAFSHAAWWPGSRVTTSILITTFNILFRVDIRWCK